jgi:hypothetical protein
VVTAPLLILRLALQSPDSTPLTAVRAAVEHDPIEAFGSTIGHVRVRGLQQLDLDKDGSPEVFVWIEPSFRQTPTVLVYAYSASRGVHRFVQALVPGRLRPVSDSLQDSHTLGRAVDMTVGHGEAVDTSKFIAAAVARGMSLVGYKGFFHADMRDGFVSFVSLFDRQLPAGDTATCNSFEFSPVEGVLVGRLEGDTVNPYLVALTDSDLTIYRFYGIAEHGTFNMRSWMRPRPRNVAMLTLQAAGVVAVKTRDGSMSPIRAP